MPKQIPKEKGLDHSLDMLREGYLFISNRSQGFQSDIFETRLLGERAICLRGEEGAKLFYDNQKFTRVDASPKRVLKTLFGEGGVQTLDGKAHEHRKAMFMSLMNPESMQRIRAIVRKEWTAAAKRMENCDNVILYEEAQEIMCRAACAWAGVPLETSEADHRTEQLSSIIEATASFGPTHWKGRHSRSKAEKWIAELVTQVRDGNLLPPENKALSIISYHHDHEGELLPAETAAVEILNLLRPIVAVAIYICFTALALHQQPAEKAKLTDGDERKLQNFVQEVRRFYPFFPFVPARVRQDFIWNDYQFEEDCLTILDLYGTNHHPKLWNQPELFQPERFSEWKESPFSFIPQGGGDYDFGHRCAGEWMTVEIMKESLNFLANHLQYEIPDQDVSFSFNDMPSLPHSKIVMTNVSLK